MRIPILYLMILGLLLVTAGSSFGDVYVNMLWDESSESFKVKPLNVEGGLYFDRGYQNAYGEYLGLDPGPPFIVQSSISANGSVTFASGGFDPMRPFSIQIDPDPGHGGAINGSDGVNFVGTMLDPIHIEGRWQINAGLDYQHGGSEMQWSYTTFDCTYDYDFGNTIPFEISGLGLRANNCLIRNLSNDFFYLMAVNDFNAATPEYDVAFQNCTFENLDFFDRMRHAISLKNLRAVTIEGCRFDNVDVAEYDEGGLIYMHTCGVSSIKNNTSQHCNYSKIHMINAEVIDSAYIECSDKLPIVANNVLVPVDKALAIGKGSVIKFLAMGGFDVKGRLWADSAVFTSWEDDEYGGDTDLKPEPDPFIGNWYAHGSGIWIDTTGSAEIRRTLIRYPRSGIHSCNALTLDSVTIENSWYTGVALRSPAANIFEISNTTIRGITRSDPYPAAIFYENRSPYSQELRLTNVTLENNVHDGIYVFYLEGGPTTIELRDCQISNNTGYGISFPVDNALTSMQITNSTFVGNYYTAIRGTDTYDSGVPIRIENNVVIGNGINEYGSQPYGIHLSSGEAKIIGNTVINNGEVGILAGGLENIEQCVIANNLIVGHTEYGLYKSDDGEPIVVGNEHWNNGDEVEELRYRGPDGWLYTVEDLQALGGNFVTNINVEPGLVPSIYGEIDTLSYDSHSGQSKLVDVSAGFTQEMISGRMICADTADPHWYPIDSLSGDTLFIVGDIREHADSGSVYQLLNYHISETSQLIDAGFTSQTTATFDIDGDARILDGDENGSMLVDIGADEFNGEDASSPVRVLEPSSEKYLVAYQSFNIEWQVPDSVASVDIDYNTKYDPAQPDVGWATIAAGTDASSNYYTWHVPQYETTSKCYIRIKSTAHPDLSGMSAPFKIKHTGFTRIRNDSLITYVHPDNSWSFENDSATMWPAGSWPNYETDNDPITGFAYPDDFINPTNATPADYPSWPAFVEAYGVDACYFDSWAGYLYRTEAVLRWRTIKDKWGGSCFGLAITNLMAFQDSATFAARPEIGPFGELNSLAITDPRRNLISRYFTYQYGRKNIDHENESFERKPSETLAELKSMFSKLEVSIEDRVLTLCDTSTVNGQGCHTVTPYQLDRLSETDDTWMLFVYDNSYPADIAFIDIDAKNESWGYAWFGWTGNKEFYLEDPLSNYTDPAVMTTAPSDLLPVAAAEGYTELYLTAGDSVQIKLGVGSIGMYDDSLFNDIPGAKPILPKAAGPVDPIGYVLPEGDLSCHLTGSDDDHIQITAFADSVVMSYRRDGASPTEKDRVDFRGGDRVYLFNSDNARTCDVDIVRVHADRERLLRLSNLYLDTNDSGSVELTSTEQPRLVNYGGESFYNVLLRDVSSDGLKQFSHDNLTLAANSVSQLEPEWSSLDDSLAIIIDYGRDGVFEDTIVISNDSPTDVGDQSDNNLPYRFELSQNYPNPFNPITTIRYNLPRRSHVTIEVFNVLGQKVRTLVDRVKAAGSYTITWDGQTSAGVTASTGVYLYRFRAGDYAETKKMLLLK